MNTATGKNIVGSGTTATQISNRPASQTESELAKLRESVESISSAVSELENRLASVLRAEPSQVTPGAQPMPPDEFLVPHADSLRGIRRNAEYATDRLSGILNRLEA